MSWPSLRDRVRESLGAFAAAARNRDLQRLQLAYLGSAMGQWAGSVAVTVFSFEEAGAGGVALQLALRMIPAAVVAPLGGVVADRYRRERVMVTCDIVGAALAVIMVVLVIADVWYVSVLLVSGLRGVVGTAFQPAKAALLPALAREPDELTAANVVSSAIESVSVLAGPALGAILLSVSSVEVVLIVMAAGMLWSAALITRIHVPRRTEPAEVSEEPRLVHALTRGFGAVASNHPVRLVVLLVTAQTFVYGMLTVLSVAAAFDLLDMGRSGFGILQAAEGAGAILGAVASVLLVGRKRLAPSLALGLALYGLSLILFGVIAVPAAAIGALAVLGLANSVIDVSAFTLLQRAAPDEVLGRVFGVLETAILASIAAGGAVAAPLIDAVDIDRALVVAGAVLPMVVLVSWVSLTRLDATAEGALPAGDLALLRGVPMFAPLPAITIEELARALRPLHAHAGEDIVRQGEPGDRFYLVAAGDVDVFVDGRIVRTQRSGESFGEIALLRDEPRSATVRARSDTELRALERAPFLTAVTGHTDSAEAAEAVMRARLAHAHPSLVPA
jgi:MFS family permease